MLKENPKLDQILEGSTPLWKVVESGIFLAFANPFGFWHCCCSPINGRIDSRGEIFGHYQIRFASLVTHEIHISEKRREREREKNCNNNFSLQDSKGANFYGLTL